MVKLFTNDKFILTLILINSFIIFLSGFDIYNEIFDTIDYVITFLFFIELTIKLITIGPKKYFKSNWNIFDFILIVSSIPSFFSLYLDIDVEFLLVFRILRIFKSFRFFKFIPNIDHLLNGLKQSLVASVVVLITFVVYIFIIGILSFYMFRGLSPDFDNPLISLYSILKVFTIEGWYDIPYVITENLTGYKAVLTHIYFVFILLTGGIFGLSMMNAIFVDAMVSDNNDELEEKVDLILRKLDKPDY